MTLEREKTLDPKRVELSVVCPFFNEVQILETAVTRLLERMRGLGVPWELIIVSDGSVDGSREVAERIAESEPRLAVLGYPHNKGRGYALRTGIEAAGGDIVITTEIDLSWGDDIVERLHQAMVDHPEIDIVVASPHLKGGGYRNVPFKRVFFSRFGNWIIRRCMSNAVSMNTGMTRAYRTEVIRSLPLEEDEKEFHLEVVLKAQALKYRFHEIPTVLEWKEYKQAGRRVQRKSSSKVKRLVVTHSLFSLFANPIRYVWMLAAGSLLISAAFLLWGVVRFFVGEVSVFTLIIALSFGIISILLFASGVIAQQGNMIQSELWRIQRHLKILDSRDSAPNSRNQSKDG